MKISKLIEELIKAQNTFGDLKVHTYRGDIRFVKTTGAKDGVISPISDINEICIELLD